MPKKSDFTPEEYAEHIRKVKERYNAIMADPIKKEEYYKKRKEWAAKNKQRRALKRAEWRAKNAEKLNEKERQRYYANHDKIRPKINARTAERTKLDIEFKLRRTLSSRIRMAFKDCVKESSCVELLGCTLDKYKEHLESTFSEGMTWDNYGTTWHVDHIYPVSRFNMLTQSGVAFNYRNTRAMFAEDNLIKNRKLPDSIPRELYDFLREHIVDFKWEGVVQNSDTTQ